MTSTDAFTTADWGETYCHLGFAVYKVEPAILGDPGTGKAPLGGKAWQTRPIPLDRIRDEFPEGSNFNIGVGMGEKSGGLCDIDLDCREATHFTSFLPPTGLVFGRRSRPKSHFIYRADQSTKSEKFIDPGKDGKTQTIAECRPSKYQTVFPPSMHFSGERVEWVGGSISGDPPVYTTETLMAAAKVVAAGSLIARHWPSGSRHDAALALAGGLLRLGWTAERTKEFVSCVCSAAGDEETLDRLTGAETTIARLESDQNATGWPSLAKLLGDDIAYRAADWLGYRRPSEVTRDMGEGRNVFGSLNDWALIAEAFLATYDIDTGQGLILWRDDWYAFQSGAWRRIDDGGVAADATSWLRGQSYRKGDGDEPIPIVRKSSEELMAHLRKIARINAPSAPCWMSGNGPDPSRLVVFRNGMIDADDALRTGTITLLPPNPRLFSLGALPYDYDPEAKCPEFDRFLKTALPDEASRNLMQEWMGLTLIPDLSFERMMFLEGHPAGGKGTMIAAHQAMLGPDLYTTTSISDLASEFGKHGLIGKLAAFDGDAHLARSVDSTKALEAVKRITGRDPISVNRKNQAYLHNVTINARMTMAVNRFPNWSDAGGAMNRRSLTVRFMQDFSANPEHGLKARVTKEGPGICNWAIQGLLRLLENQEFTVPAVSAELLAEVAVDNNPILSFRDDRCVMDPASETTVKELFEDYEGWCAEVGIDRPKNNRQFAKDLYESVRGIDRRREGKRRYVTGIKLDPLREPHTYDRR